MADRILVSSEAMQACIASYDAAKGKMMECVMTYTTALLALATDYTGVAATAMAGKVNTMLGNIKASYEKIDDCTSELKNAMEVFAQTETATITAGAGVDKGTPFSV